MGSLIGLIISFLVGTAVLHIAVKLAAGDASKQATFGTTCLANGLLLVICGLLSHVPLIGWLGALIASFVIVMQVYKIGFGRTLLVWLIYIFIVGGLVAILSFFFGFALVGLGGLAAIFG